MARNSLGKFMPDFNAFKGSVKGTDALIGSVSTLGGIAALNYIKAKFGTTLTFLTNPTVARFMPVIAGVVAGVGGSAAAKAMKKGGHAPGILVGAISTGIALQALAELKTKYPAYFADIVDLRLAGFIVDDPIPRQMGMLVDDRAPALPGFSGYNSNLSELAALDMSLGDNTDLESMGIG